MPHVVAEEGPRTRHLLPDGSPRFTNRLLSEPSPYLQQHAHNPVDWWPWGAEAFAEARRLGRPVLLSVGYATCHWCHVMEEESFEDLEIARFVNEHYVAIKVDREERPDVDAVYMAAVQLFTGHGGWPMTVWLDPEARPFYAGTYIPARDGDRGASMGLLSLLKLLERAYREDPRVSSSVETAVEAVREVLTPAPGDGSLPSSGAAGRAISAYARRYDASWGGLTPAPKFPSSLPARLLLRERALGGDERGRRMALRSLAAMGAGGIFDQIGGGFHRYSTDERWLVPHFEKMLYDNALLVLDYLEAYQVTGDAAHAEVVRDTLAWIQREMTAPSGALYAATDADSLGPDGERKEGLFFTWTVAELEAALGRERARAVALRYGVTAEGQLEGRSVLHQARSVEEVAAQLGSTPAAIAVTLDEARAELLRVRTLRPPPLRDEKVLAAWNGLAIAALARAARVLEPGIGGGASFLARARRAAGFALSDLLVDGRLRRVWKDGLAYVDGTLEDYAFLAWGLLELHQASGELRWLEAAVALEVALAEGFEAPAGGFYRSAHDAEVLIARELPVHDGAMPSGNAVHARNLLTLAALTGDDAYRRRADRVFIALGRSLEEAPWAVSELSLALQQRHAGTVEVALVAPSDREELEPFLAALARQHLPHHVLAAAVVGKDLDAQAARVALLRDRATLGGQPTAFVCRGGVCQRPTTGVEAFVAQLRAAR